MLVPEAMTLCANTEAYGTAGPPTSALHASVGRPQAWSARLKAQSWQHGASAG